MILHLNYCAMNCLWMIYHRFQGRFQGVLRHFPLKVWKNFFFRAGQEILQKRRKWSFVPCPAPKFRMYDYKKLLSRNFLKFGNKTFFSVPSRAKSISLSTCNSIIISFPVINNWIRTTAAAGAGLKRSLGIHGECFLAIHTLIVLISRFDWIFRRQFHSYWKLQLNFLILGTASIKSKKRTSSNLRSRIHQLA